MSAQRNVNAPRNPIRKFTGENGHTVASLQELRDEVHRLEGVVAEGRRLYLEMEASDTKSGDSNTEHRDSEGVEDQLRARRNTLRRAIKQAELEEKLYASDPRVMDKMNEVRLVRMQIADIEKGIATLNVVKRRRDVCLRQIGRTEETVRQIRGQQLEASAKRRLILRDATEELKELERQDLELHERFCRLQDQLKLGVTEKEVHALEETIKRQEWEIKELLSTMAEWKQRNSSSMNTHNSNPRDCTAHHKSSRE